jgi:hypothetical protein
MYGWIQEMSTPLMAGKAIAVLLWFSPTHWSEKAFVTYAHMKTKYRSRLILNLTWDFTVHQWFKAVCGSKQVHTSHWAERENGVKWEKNAVFPQCNLKKDNLSWMLLSCLFILCLIRWKIKTFKITNAVTIIAGYSDRAVWGVGLGRLVAGIVGSNSA